MKKRIVFASVFLCFFVFNLTHGLNYGKADINLYKLGKITSANAECTTCPWYMTCIRRVESISVTCEATTTITRTYYTTSAKTTWAGTASGANFTLTAGIATQYYTDSTGGCSAYQATKVKCPTDGDCTCTEYNPC